MENAHPSDKAAIVLYRHHSITTMFPLRCRSRHAALHLVKGRRRAFMKVLGNRSVVCQCVQRRIIKRTQAAQLQPRGPKDRVGDDMHSITILGLWPPYTPQSSLPVPPTKTD